jgi:hypothetical protein
MDGSGLSLPSRVVPPLAVLLALVCSGNGVQPGIAGGAPARPAVQATPELPHGILGRQLHVVGFSPDPVVGAAQGSAWMGCRQPRSPAGEQRSTVRAAS